MSWLTATASRGRTGRPLDPWSVFGFSRILATSILTASAFVMICRGFSTQRTSMRRAALAVAAVTALLAGGIAEAARNGKSSDAKRIEIVQSRPAGRPIMAVVSLSNQRVTIYDAIGWIMRAPVSSGRKGYETPAGIYSVIQKEVEHYSNLYEDGYMPFMQRITWSGIALHGGPLPGYAASHGCVRMPVEFAERLFDLTRIGMRVIVAPNDPVPVEFSHPVLGRLNPARVAGGGPEAEGWVASDLGVLASAKPVQTLQSMAAAKAAEAEAAIRKADAARLNAIQKTGEASRIAAALHLAESTKSRLELRVRAAESALESADSPDAIQLAEKAKADALARLADAEVRLTAAGLAAQGKPDVVRARQEAEAAEAERKAAVEVAAEAARKAAPVSVFISRKTQRLYARQSFQPIFDIAVTIRDPDQPIGTHIFTALDYIHEGTDIRWSAASMDPSEEDRSSSAGEPGRRGYRSTEPTPQPAGTAGSALERLVIPRETIDRISELVSPGSSLIISDEGISSETGNHTDFVVLMSGEPQGGIKMRRRNPDFPYRYFRPYGIFWR